MAVKHIQGSPWKWRGRHSTGVLRDELTQTPCRLLAPLALTPTWLSRGGPSQRGEVALPAVTSATRQVITVKGDV